MPFLIPLLIKYVLPVLTILGLLSWGGYSVWDKGRQAERQVWLVEEAKWKTDMLALAETSRKRADKQRQEFSKLLARERNEKDRNNKTINDLAASITNSGLYVSAENCSSGDRTAEAGHTGKSTGGADRIRLGGTDEKNLSAYAADALRLTAQYNTLRELVKSSDCFKIID